MPLRSGKFKYLELARAYLPEGVIPVFFKLDSKEFPLPESSSWILRSALKGEGSEQLLSGKSLSRNGINSREKLETAFEELSKQSELEEIILQKEIHWEQHHTVIWEKDFLFIETRDQTGASHTTYWTPLSKTENQSSLARIRQLLHPLLALLEKHEIWILEIGEREGRFNLFQIQPISSQVISRIFPQKLVSRIISSRLRFSRKISFAGLLQIEWRARKFRKRSAHSPFHLSFVFQNWEFIFHYFRLFCMMKGLQPSGESFSRFLSESHRKTMLGELLLSHLKLANLFREKEEDPPQDIVFQDQGQRFIGNGTYSGKIGQDVMKLEKLDLGVIYSSNPPKVIISKDVSILSHPVLACVERGIRLVLGVENTLFSSLSDGQGVICDFEKQSFHLI